MNQKLIRKSLLSISLSITLPAFTAFSQPAKALGNLVVETEEVETPIEVIETLLDLQDSRIEDDYIAKNTQNLARTEGVVDLDFIVNTGKEVWKVIEAGQPTLSETHNYASALPQGISKTFELQGFSGLEYKSYRLVADNTFGMRMIDVVFTVAHRFGGSYKGEGKYLADVTVIPSDIEVSWGYTLDMGVDNIRVANIGKREDPVAGLSLEVSLKISTMFQKNVIRRLLDFRGDSPKARVIR